MKDKVTIIKNGPLVLEGNFKIKHSTGKELEQEAKVYLCRCGRSKNKPYCDGEHKR